MKKAFTLIEMMIVVAVLTTLITLVFRLTANTDEQTARVKTIMRLQRLENCLSGFYAAFGSYPPVALHGSRDIFSEVNDVGVQKDNGERNENIWNDEALAWKQVRAACKSQPVACNFPFDDKEMFQLMIEQWSEQCKQVIEAAGSGIDQDTINQYSAGFSGLSNESGAAGELSRYRGVSEWRTVQLFRFGLMSYLLPRYMLMTAANADFYDFAQWSKNNTNPCDPYTGQQMTWNEINSISRDIARDDDGEGDISRRNRNRIGSIPTQKVVARWLPNLEGICFAPRNRIIYGIDISETDATFPPEPTVIMSGVTPVLKNFPSDLFTPGGKEGYSDQYLLDFITVQDGYGNDFYYYSPSPHQRYQLWSAGKDGKTFPPWIAKEDLPSEASEIIHRWTKDDIIQMSH